MAQVDNIDLSTLTISDGTFEVPAAGSIRVQQIGQVVTNYLKTLSRRFNDSASLVQANGGRRVQFIGGLLKGYSLWRYLKSGSNVRNVDEILGHPSGNHFRSAENFANHVAEIIARNKQNQMAVDDAAARHAAACANASAAAAQNALNPLANFINPFNEQVAERISREGTDAVLHEAHLANAQTARNSALAINYVAPIEVPVDPSRPGPVPGVVCSCSKF